MKREVWRSFDDDHIKQMQENGEKQALKEYNREVKQANNIKREKINELKDLKEHEEKLIIKTQSAQTNRRRTEYVDVSNSSQNLPGIFRRNNNYYFSAQPNANGNKYLAMNPCQT